MVLLLTIFGLLIGSFLNALIYRLPRNINIAFPRSSCPNCNKVITWYENIPVLSYLFLRGKCSGCGTKISSLYPAVEIITGLVAFLLAPQTPNPIELSQFFFLFSVFCVFLVHFIIDLKHQLLPDSLNLYLAVLFLVAGFFKGNWGAMFIGGAIGLGFPLLVSWIFYQLKGQVGLGGGDIKLYGALGLYLGPVGIMQNLFLSCFLGAVVGIVFIALKLIKRENPIPFGPFILLVAAIQILTPGLYGHVLSYIP